MEQSADLAAVRAAAVALRDRPKLTDPDERDDIKQMILVLLACLQRERARADQFYVRARNLLAFASALFTAVQVAFLANLGRTSGRTVLITKAERSDIAIPAVAGAGLLVLAVLLLVLFADRARSVNVVRGKDVIDAWANDERYPAEAVLETLAAKLAAEETSWSKANKTRGRLNLGLAALTLLVAAAAITELVLLYQSLA